MNYSHYFCEKLLLDFPKGARKGLAATYTKIGDKKFFLVQSGSGNWNWEGVADCVYDAKRKALIFWNSIKPEVPS